MVEWQPGSGSWYSSRDRAEDLTRLAGGMWTIRVSLIGWRLTPAAGAGIPALRALPLPGLWRLLSAAVPGGAARREEQAPAAQGSGRLGAGRHSADEPRQPLPGPLPGGRRGRVALLRSHMRCQLAIVTACDHWSLLKASPLYAAETSHGPDFSIHSGDSRLRPATVPAGLEAARANCRPRPACATTRG